MSRAVLAVLFAGVLCLFAAPGFAADWQPAKGPLMTKWAKDVSPDTVHAEYPRPQMLRGDLSWQNLNGLWDYAITKSDAKWEKADGQILVPFPIESALSGVMKRVAPEQKLWYRRTFKSIAKDDGRLLLHFGAVDWKCEVLVNGKSVGSHTGGYDPFSFDITDALKKDAAEQELVIAVTDPSDTNWQPRGKQVLKPGGIFYTPITGIWQTVWLEKVPRSYIKSLKIVPDIDNDSVNVTVEVAGDAKDVELKVLDGVDVRDSQAMLVTSKGAAGKTVTLKLAKPKLWSPNSPFLYGLQVELTSAGKIVDKVDSYFGMRKISLGKDEQGLTRILLNNKFVFQYGPLDQGFWPDGLYTAPTDAALKYDLDVTKELGFNMVRKHVKTEPARWYYHCDKMGLLVWQDMPSGDKSIGPNDPDIKRSEASAKNFEHEWSEIVHDFGNHPCIVMWVPFNEGWGQYDVARIVDYTRKLDPSRLVNNASGWADRNVGDVNDMHNYPGPGMPKPESKRAVVLGEFGGLGLPLEGHTWQGKDNWGYKSFTKQADLNAAYLQLVDRLRPLIGKGLSAAVYTQTTDVEVEVNGFMTYDRAVLKLEKDKASRAHARLYAPPPVVKTLVETSQEKPQVWRYTFAKPAEGWEKSDFDASKWNEGPGGFGEPSTPGSVVKTNWKTPDIWLRQTVKLDGDDFSGVQLLAHWDEDSEVYINGTLVTKLAGWSTEYTLVSLDEKAAKALRKGENVIAIHTHQNTGGQYIDVGLVRMIEQ